MKTLPVFHCTVSSRQLSVGVLNNDVRTLFITVLFIWHHRVK